MTSSRDYVRDSIYDPFRRNPAQTRKIALERLYLRILQELSLSRITWIGLPDTIDERFLELTLFNRGLAIFYWDEEFNKYMALRGSGAGVVNMYDNPTKFIVTGNTIIPSKTLDGNECVPIWNNRLRLPDWELVHAYAVKLAEMDRTIELEIKALRHPFVITVDDSQKQSMIQAYRMVSEGQPVIFGTNALSEALESMQVLDMKQHPDNLINMMIAKTRIWSECMTMLGINNTNVEKRERMVAGEVSANDSQVLMIRNGLLNPREQAADEINRLYGLDVHVVWNNSPSMIIGQSEVN
jgi:hypothetical protein